MSKNILFLLIVLLGSPIFPTFSQSLSEDSIRLMFYNLLNFPDPNPDGKEDTLINIINYVQPDLLMVCELKSSAGADLILNTALNADGLNTWRRAEFTTNSSSGADIQQLVFYNQFKFSLFSQSVIQTHVRDINEYTFYMRDPFLAGHNDTTWLDVYVTHLKAGDSDSDAADRARMADSLRSYLNTRPAGRNVVFSGDFNLYSSFESAWSTILATGADIELVDPIDRSGSWNNNSSFADVHTQSTRTSGIFGDGSGGGMDSRFDFITLSGNMMQEPNRITFLSGSYDEVGNDGSCYNQSILNCSSSPVPLSVRRSMYYMSDHIPVVLDLSVSYPIFSGIEQPSQQAVHIWFSAGQLIIHWNYDAQNVWLNCIGMDGKIHFRNGLRLESGTNRIALPTLPSGLYLAGIVPKGNTGLSSPVSNQIFIP